MTNSISSTLTGVVPDFTLGDRLRKAREIRGWDAQELAEQLGIHRQSVAKYERGGAVPRRAVLMAWAFTTGVDLAWLQGEDVRPEGFEPPTYCSVADEIVCQCGHADFKHDGFGDCLVCGCVDWQGDIDAELRALLEAVAS